jgi:hypothetical protein
MTAMILANMAPDHLYPVWGGSYSEVMAEIRDAFWPGNRAILSKRSGRTVAEDPS